MNRTGQVAGAHRKLAAAQQRDHVRDLTLSEVLAGKYPVFYADPPWEYRNSGFYGAAARHYPTLPTEAICALPVPAFAAANAALFLWATNPLLPDALRVMAAWGFEYKTNFVWVKDKALYGKLGFYNYGAHELLLLGIRGAMPPACDPLPVSLIEAPKSEHSRKPAAAYALIERMYPEGPYVELFARSTRSGWTAFGNEVQTWPNN
ncbi:MAG: DNA methyltransferase [Anaerolineae bacterium]|nr:DNA methyltransferase [Anaerolineae bacterium]